MIQSLKPLVSIGLRVYNGEMLIAQALDSLLAQTYKNIELIISDNASTDQTEKICRAYAKRDKRVRYFRQPNNIGPTKNFGFVLKKSKSNFFMWASHDDYWMPGFIEKIMKVMVDNPRLALVQLEARYMLEDGKKLPFFPEGVAFWHGLEGSSPQAISKLVRHSYGNLIYGIYRKEYLYNIHNNKSVVDCMGAEVLNEIPVYVNLVLNGGKIQVVEGRPMMLKRTNLNTYFAASKESGANVFRTLNKFGVRRWLGINTYLRNIHGWLKSKRYHTQAVTDILKVVEASDLTKANKVGCRKVVKKVVMGHYRKVIIWAIVWKMRPVVSQ